MTIRIEEVDEYLLMETIRAKFIKNDVHISVNGSYIYDGIKHKIDKRYDINFDALELIPIGRHNDYLLIWVEAYIIDDLKTLVLNKGLNIICSDEHGGGRWRNVFIQSEPTYSIYSDDEDWIDGTYAYINLENHRKMFKINQ